MRALIENDVPGIQQLIKTTFTHGGSLDKILERIMQSASGVLKTRKYSEGQTAMATLLYRLGGRDLVFSGNKALHLPSITTTRGKFKRTILHAQLGRCGTKEIATQNIAACFAIDPNQPVEPPCGWSISLDEINLDERAVFMKEENCVGGLCREHTIFDDLTIVDFDQLQALSYRVHPIDGSVASAHYGKEATVVGIAPFRSANYDIKPILISATCKSDTAADSVLLLEAIVDAWMNSPNGAPIRGPVDSIASDGDAIRRLAFYMLYTKQELQPGTDLWNILSELIGLNLFTGAFDITMDFDLKHIVKRRVLLVLDRLTH